MARGKQKKAAASKPAAKPKPKAKSKAKAKARPATAAADDDEREPDDLEMMLETLACPVATADRLWSVCEDAFDRAKEDLAGVHAAELVWAQRPGQEVLAAAATALAEELVRHANAVVTLLDQLGPIADADEDHADLDVPDVLERLKPLTEGAAAED